MTKFWNKKTPPPGNSGWQRKVLKLTFSLKRVSGSIHCAYFTMTLSYTRVPSRSEGNSSYLGFLRSLNQDFLSVDDIETLLQLVTYYPTAHQVINLF